MASVHDGSCVRATGSRRRLLLIAAAGGLGLPSATSPAFAGPLDPPPGPPKPTMKRLDQIEPRRCLNDLPGSDGAVIVVAQPGKYYLTADVDCPAGKTAIVVDCPGGDVVIDLNGFALRGEAGSLDGVRVRSASSVIVTGQGVGGAEGPTSLIRGFGGNGIVVGDPNGDGCSDVFAAGIRVEDCAGVGLLHLHAQKIVHRDIAARNCAGGGIAIFGDDRPPQPGQRRRGNSVSLTRCEVTDCGGAAAVRVVCPGGGRVRGHSLDMARCTGDGLAVSFLAGAGGAPPAGTLVLERCAVEDAGGSGVVVSGVAGCDVEVRPIRVELKRCAGDGLRVSDAAALDADGLSVSDAAGVAVRATRPGRTKYKNITFRSSGGGLESMDAGSVAVEGAAIEDIAGDGVVVARCGSVALSGEVRGASARPDGTGGRGVVLADCASAKVSDFGLSRCASHGCVHEFSDAGSTPGSCSIEYDRVSISSAGGAGVSITDARSGVHELEARLRGLGVLACAGGGAVVRSSGAGGHGHLCGDTSHFRSCGGPGVGVTGHPASSWTVDLKGVTCTNNAADGLSVVTSGGPDVAFAGGSVTLAGCDLSGNGACGVQSSGPLFVDKGSLSQNALHGARCAAPDPFTLAGSMTGVVLQRNGAASVKVARGRYTSSDCRISDGGGAGVELDAGCLLMTNTDVHRCAGPGVDVHGTLTIQGGALRRNAGPGIRCSDGSCVARDCSVELNGGGFNGAGGGGGGGAVFLNCSAVTVQRCVFNDNSGDGVKASSSSVPTKWMAPECIASRNTGSGFALANAQGTLEGCVATGNGEWGYWMKDAFDKGTIRRCSADGNGGGFRVDGTGNLVVGNSATLGAAGLPPFAIAPGNSAGTIVDGGALGQRCSSTDNIIH